ncbi:MAG: DoxX family protein [Pseudonocardia sp.]
MTATTAPTRPAIRTLTRTVTRTGADGPIRDAVLLAFRVVTSFLFFLHAIMAFGALGGMDGAGAAAPFGSLPFVAGSIQAAGAVLIALGLHTRAAAFILSGVMAFAYFSVHAPLGWNPLQNMGEPAALYSWIFLAICAVGGGRYALDTLRRTR